MKRYQFLFYMMLVFNIFQFFVFEAEHRNFMNMVKIADRYQASFVSLRDTGTQMMNTCNELSGATHKLIDSDKSLREALKRR